MNSQSIRNLSTLSHALNKTFPHKLSLRTSKYLRRFGLILTLGAVLTLFKLGFPIYLAILPICYHIFTKSPPQELLEISPGYWAIYRCDQLTFEGKVTGDSFLSSRLILLNLKEKISGKTRRTLILSDMLSAEQFRRLKVQLLLTSKTLADNLH